MKRPGTAIIEKLFEYDDYRRFLRDYFQARAGGEKRFSQRAFAARAGFRTHNYATLVSQGERNLSARSCAQIVRALGLRGRAATFFTNLVGLNQARTLDEKEFYFRKLRNSLCAVSCVSVDRSRYFFYEKWYYPVVRELMVLSDWNGDHARLGRMVLPAITPSEAQEAVLRLVQAGMVIDSGNGAWRLADPFVTSQGVPAYYKRKARRDVLLRGVEAADTIDSPRRYTAYATVALSEKLYGRLREMLVDVRAQVLSMAAGEEPGREVYEVVFQAFPVSHMHTAGDGPRGGADEQD